MTKLYAKHKGMCTVSLFDFLKTWPVNPLDGDMMSPENFGATTKTLYRAAPDKT